MDYGFRLMELYDLSGESFLHFLFFLQFHPPSATSPSFFALNSPVTGHTTGSGFISNNSFPISSIPTGDHRTIIKMQKSLVNYDSSTDPSPSSSSQFHSLITTHSLLSSSIDSSSSFQSSSPTRCLGLNLLVKAIHQVTAGSVVGVPYIQKRIITRRRRPLQFNNLILATTQLLSKSESRSRSKPKSKARRQRRVNMTMPSKYRDSVLQPLTPKRRSERSQSVNVTGE
ncbi:hypothetical protein L1987_61412 [Smallanthus sonchifolius]|uniref:Uncharacterized protein n=1 Tax=Smallanthus sonchifolius TaxID=185202 RepID=A0ACB9C7N3_9ASTR|nr:hypothetical protein L1987_61412 [Smallanthus sonchifolius]